MAPADAKWQDNGLFAKGVACVCGGGLLTNITCTMADMLDGHGRLYVRHDGKGGIELTPKAVRILG